MLPRHELQILDLVKEVRFHMLGSTVKKQTRNKKTTPLPTTNSKNNLVLIQRQCILKMLSILNS